MKPNNNITRQIMVDTELLAYLSDTSTVCNRLYAFNDLLMSAVETPQTITKRGINISLKPGQLEASILALSNKWKWHRKTIAVFLDELESRGYIKRVSNKLSTIIEVTCLSECATESTTVCATESAKHYPSESIVQYPTDLSHLPSVVHRDPPMQLSDETHRICRQVYDLFIETFPRLDKPEPYDDNIEKDIYYVFFLGMRGDFALLKRYFEIINADPFKNGTIADSSGTSPYKESFHQLFSTNWQLVFDCATEYNLIIHP